MGDNEQAAVAETVSETILLLFRSLLICVLNDDWLLQFGQKDTTDEPTNTTDDEKPESYVTPANPYTFPDDERQMYEKLCRGAAAPSQKVLARLRCRYFDNNNPYLRIGPVKVEEAFLKPRILVFHDVVFDEEIDVITSLATPRVWFKVTLI